MPDYLVTLGDSVHWGQGLRREHKLHAIVEAELAKTHPTVVQQVEAFVGEPADVIGVLVNGGINDIDIRNILNPFVSQAALGAMTAEHCYDSMPGTNIVVAKCMQFWQESTAALNEAVTAANATLPAPRAFIADPGFTEDNAVFAGDPWLFGLANDPLLSPQDEVVTERRNACDLAYPVTDWAARQQCYRASAGHPNVKGARKYADAILANIM